MNRTVTLLCFLITLVACGQSAPQQKPYVVVVSIDGFRHDYVDLYDVSSLKAMKQTGAWSQDMLPSFPSKTFPNHYTLATGMLPGNHGIVGNSFYSRSKQERYAIGSRAKVEDGSWYGGTPLWVLAEQQGITAASFFWVGSEADVQGVRPTYWKRYDGSIPNQKRVDQVLQWLSLDAGERPQLIFLYFSLVDAAGHRYGPESEGVQKAVQEVNALLTDLRKRLAQTGLPVHLIVTSDHGMTGINRGIDVSDVDFHNAVVDISSTMLMVYHHDAQVLQHIAAQLRAKEPLQAYTQQQMARQFNLKNADRVGDIVAVCQPPTVILKSPRRVSGGTHGYDPRVYPDMKTIFFAEGPRIRPGTAIGTFKNVHVYPLVVALLQLQGPDHPIDGDLSIWQKVLIK